MRRRRLIGVYRGLLMSIWMPWLRFAHDAGNDVRGGGTMRRDENATRPLMQASRSRTPVQSRRRELFRAPHRRESPRPSVALTIVSRYARPRAGASVYSGWRFAVLHPKQRGRDDPVQQTGGRFREAVRP